MGPLAAGRDPDPGGLLLLPYYCPGDMALAEAVREAAKSHNAMLPASHGPVAAGKSLDAAVCDAEEREGTAKLFLTLRGCNTRWLNGEQVAALRKTFHSREKFLPSRDAPSEVGSQPHRTRKGGAYRAALPIPA